MLIMKNCWCFRTGELMELISAQCQDIAFGALPITVLQGHETFHLGALGFIDAGRVYAFVQWRYSARHNKHELQQNITPTNIVQIFLVTLVLLSLFSKMRI